ncbi:MAG: hypothetical protein WCJ30_05820, partial [Deltaproteobacteria bacterium]
AFLGCAALLTACGPVSPAGDGGGDAADIASDAATDAPPDVSAFVMAPGAVVEVPLGADGTAAVRLATPTGSEQFVVVLASTVVDGTVDALGYTVATTATGAVTTPATVSTCSLTPDRWRAMTLPPETPPSGTGPAVGAMRSITMDTPTGVTTIMAQAVAVGTRAVVWADMTPAHLANLDPAFVTQFLADFENVILARERAIFGIESDLDGDGHIHLVFSPLTYRTAVAYFTGCDLVPASRGCRTSNHGEFLYLTPPASILPPYNTVNAIKEILAHECSHLIHFNRKVLRNHLTTDWPDNSYMIEGVGGFGQDAIGYQAGNLYVTKAGLDGVDGFSFADVIPNGGIYDTTRDGLLRGGSYLWVRWLYDRAGGDQAEPDGTITNRGGPSLIRTLLDSPVSMTAALPTAGVANAPIGDLVMDFYTTLAMSNRDAAGGVAPLNGCFAYLPTVRDPVSMDQRGCSVFASFHGMMMGGPATQPVDSADGSLTTGGVEYIQVDAVAGQATRDVAVTVPTTGGVRVRIGRVR